MTHNNQTLITFRVLGRALNTFNPPNFPMSQELLIAFS